MALAVAKHTPCTCHTLPTTQIHQCPISLHYVPEVCGSSARSETLLLKLLLPILLRATVWGLTTKHTPIHSDPFDNIA